MKTKILELETQIKSQISSLRPDNGEKGWPLLKVQSVYSNTVQSLNELRSELSENNSTNAEDDSFSRRHKIELDRLQYDLASAITLRKKHSEEMATQELMSNHRQKGGSSLNSENSSSGAVEEAKAITSSLRRTYAMMNDTLAQADEAKTVIQTDSEVFTDVFDQHRHLGDSVQKAGKVLRQIQRQDEVDWWLMCFSTVFFICVVCFVTIPRIPGLTTMTKLSSSIIHSSASSFTSSSTSSNPESMKPFTDLPFTEVELLSEPTDPSPQVTDDMEALIESLQEEVEGVEGVGEEDEVIVEINVEGEIVSNAKKAKVEPIAERTVSKEEHSIAADKSTIVEETAGGAKSVLVDEIEVNAEGDIISNP
mmetsp:Transcript_22788/g.26797  ORF Transcript_22788/g.26797 Transcript_22788/m.26797 type:complete len:366 (+) Transcript_22788:1-1098(+)